MGEHHMDYISVRQAAAKWGQSERWVQKLLQDNRIDGALRFGHAWMMPKAADKPSDARIKSGKYRKIPKGNSVNE